MASQDDPNVQTDPKAPADSQPSTSAAQDALPSTPAECSSWIPTQDMIDITLSTTHASTNQEAIEILRDWRLQQFCLKCGHLFPNRSSRSRRHRCIPSVQSQPVQTQDSNDTPVSIGGFTSVVQGVKDSDHSLSAGQIVGRVCPAAGDVSMTERY